VAAATCTTMLSAVETHLPFWNKACAKVTELLPMVLIPVPISTRPGQKISAT
jgi:hypothetical protein